MARTRFDIPDHRQDTIETGQPATLTSGDFCRSGGGQ
jgi:hypothetical protein